jgi:hypothetical protein
MPTTVDRLLEYLGITTGRPGDTNAMQAAVDAANAMVAAYRSDLPPLDELNPPVWGDDVDQAATIQAGRLYGRRGSTVGVAAYQDVGVTLLPRLDPDVRALLKLGEYQDSVVS